jgi:hypothetical protein
LETSGDIADVLLLEVRNGIFSIRDNSLGILDALVNIGESFSGESTLEETFNDLDHLVDINLLLSGGRAAKEGSDS